MDNEVIDVNVRNSESIRVPFSLNYVQSAFKTWKVTFFLSLALAVLASLVLLYMEFIYYPNSSPDIDWNLDYFEQTNTPEYRSFESTYETLQLIGTLLYVMAGLVMIINFIFHLIVLYRHWNIIQQVNNPSATPARSVGFLFVPFFNIYWIFIAFYKLSVDQERFITEHGINVTTKPNPGLALAAVICRIIPYLGLLTFFILGPIRVYNQQKVSEAILKELGE